MISSRFGRVENRKAHNRLVIAIIGSIGLLIFFAIFGFKILIGFSLFVDRIRGSSPESAPNQSTLLLPPVLDPLPEATNSSALSIHGKATAKFSVIVYMNNEQYEKILVHDDGAFNLLDLPVKEGDISISSKLVDDQGNTSSLSNVISTTIDHKPPSLEVVNPQNGAKIQDGTHKVTIEGTTEENCRITINDRIGIVHKGGTFRYSMPVSDNDNLLKIISTDPAGNQSLIERRVTYIN